MLPALALRISNANHAVFAKLSYEPRQGRDDKVFIETMSQKLLFFGSIQHQTLPLACSQRLSDSEIMVGSPCDVSVAVAPSQSWACVNSLARKLAPLARCVLGILLISAADF